MTAEMCTSAPGMLQRADKTSYVQLPYSYASSKSVWSIALNKVQTFSKNGQNNGTNRYKEASGLSRVAGNDFVFHFTPNSSFIKLK